LWKLCSGALIEQQVGEKIGFSLLRWGYFGGFGLGVERTIAWLTGEQHIRQCIAFPRLMDKVYI